MEAVEKHIRVLLVAGYILMTGALLNASEYIQFEKGIQGLPRQLEGNMVRDREGFLWFCYYGGVARYDGIEVKYYKAGPGSVSGAATMSMAVDTEGQIWILTKDNGLNRYDKATDTFTWFKNDPKNPHSIASSTSENFCPQRLGLDNRGRLLVGTDSGLDIFDRQARQFIHHRHDPDNPDSLSSNNVTAVLQSRNNMIWVGTAGGGLNRLDPATGRWTRYAHARGKPDSMSSNIIWSVMEDREGMIWAGTWDRGLNRLDPETGRVTRFLHDPDDPASIRENKIVQLFEDRQGRIWLTHREARKYGLEMLDRKTGRFTPFGHDPSVPGTLSSNSVSTVYEDPETKILWVVHTYAGIIDKYDPQDLKFTLFQHHPDYPDGIASSQVGVFLEDSRGRFWISVKGALERYDRVQKKFIHYPNKTVHPDMGALVTAMVEDREGAFWMLDFGNTGALVKVDPDRMKAVKRFAHDPSNPAGIMANTMPGEALVQDRDDPDTLWLGGSGGLTQFNKKTETFTHFVHDPDDPASITKGTVWTLWDDGRGSLWVSTFGGLNRLDKSTRRFTRYVHDPDDPGSTGFNKHSCVFEDSRGTLWVAGLTNGIDRFDRKTGRFTHFNRQTGFPATGVNHTIQEDDAGYLWIGTTDAGLIKFSLDRAVVEKVYTQSDGLHGNYLWRSYKTRDGTLWFSGPAGLNSIDPARVRDNTRIPPLVFTGFRQGGDPMNLGTAPEFAKTIHLDWKENFFEFQFAALNYTKPEKNQYAYFLTGVDKDWFYAGTQPFGRYTNLEGGRYELKIKGSNNDGLWNEKGNSVQIIVRFPFWKTTGFYLILGCGLTALLSFLIINRRHLLAEIREREQVQKALRASQKQFTYAMDASRDGIFDWSLVQGTMYYSPAWKRMLGYNDDELGNDPEVREALTSSEDLDHLREMTELLVSGRLDRIEVEFRMKHRKGHWVDILCRARAICDKTGKTVRIVGTHLDITRRKKAEQQIRSLRNYLSNIIESMPSILIGVDRSGRVVFWNENAARVTGVPPVKASGQALSAVLPGYPKIDRLIRRAVRSNQPSSQQRRARTTESRQVYENITVFPLTGTGAGEAVIRIDDVTDQVKMEEVMIQSEKMMSVGGLAAGMAHEINNPLAGIIQNAQLLTTRLTNQTLPANLRAAAAAGTDMAAIAGFMENRRIPSMISAITDSGARMASIVENMLSFARKGDASFSSHDPAAIMDKSLELAATDYDLKKQYDFKSIRIEKDYGPNLPMIPCQASKLQQVIMNILSNGAYAMGSQPGQARSRFILRLKAEQRTGMLRMEIEDNGPGMDNETRMRVFEPFFTTKPEGIGTGLGLSVSYFIITEDHHGTMAVSSEPGRGTCFIIRLPVKRQPAL